MALVVSSKDLSVEFGPSSMPFRRLLAIAKCKRMAGGTDPNNWSTSSHVVTDNIQVTIGEKTATHTN